MWLLAARRLLLPVLALASSASASPVVALGGAKAENDDRRSAQADGSELLFLEVEYIDTLEGHYELGRTIGTKLRDAIAPTLKKDAELDKIRAFVETEEGKELFAAFVNDSTAAFPKYTRELEGLADGTGLPRGDLLINNLREELLQFVPDIDVAERRKSKCTTAYISSETETGFGHNDDWTQQWRRVAYIIEATCKPASGDGKPFKWRSWMYPGYLPGTDLTSNDAGVAFSVQSLFPKRFPRRGVGTAWVGRHCAMATSLDDLIARAKDQRVAAAMTYNVGAMESLQMFTLEVDAHGIIAQHRVNGSEFHGNDIVFLKVPQFRDTSTAHRLARWKELQPATLVQLRDFLGDTQDKSYPIFRSHQAPDTCYTEVTGIFNLRHGSVSMWAGTNPSSTDPARVFPLRPSDPSPSSVVVI